MPEWGYSVYLALYSSLRALDTYALLNLKQKKNISVIRPANICTAIIMKTFSTTHMTNTIIMPATLYNKDILLRSLTKKRSKSFLIIAIVINLF